MKTIFEKELLQYFHSIVGYIFLSVSVLISGYYFLVSNILGGSGDIANYFQNIVQIMIFLMPLLTMRSFAEEKRQRTEILLYTKSRRSLDIVLGKFFAALTMVAAGLACTFPFPLILKAYGSSQPALTVGGYLGILLLMGCFIAIGIFVSSLTDNQIVAAAGTYMILFLVWYSYGFGSNLQSQKLLKLLNRVSLMNRYHELIMGVLNPAGIAVLLSVTGVFLLLTWVVTERLSKPRPVTVVLGLAAVITANLFLNALTDRFVLTGDLTEGKLFEISETTREMLGNLEETVTVTYFDEEDGDDTNISELLKRYEKAGSHVQLRFVDLQANPGMAEEYAGKGITLSDNAVLVEAGENARVISWSEMYGYDSYTGGDGKIHYTLKTFKAETKITSAILQVSTAEKKAVFLTQGHGENPSDRLIEQIADGGYETEKGVPGVDEINDRYTAVVIAGAQRDFTEEEISILDEFLGNGGKLLVFRNPAAGVLPNLDGYLAEWGLAADGTVVLEPSRQIDSPLNIIPDFAVHMMNVYFSETSSFLVLPVCGSLTLTSPGGRLTAPVLKSTSASYAKAVGTASTTDPEESDLPGPFVLAATSEKTTEVQGENGKAEKAVVFLTDCCSFYEDSLLQNTSLGNAQLVLQALAYPDESEDIATIPEKSLSNIQLAVPWSATLAIGIIFIGILPALFILTGLAVFLHRRRG